MSGTAARQEVAIAGVGTTGCVRRCADSVATMANRALAAALADSGLERSQIEALFVQIGSPRGLDYDAMASQLALDVRYASQTWSHGRFLATVIQHACMVLREGLAEVALCLGAFRNSPFDRHGTPGFPDFGEAIREARGPHAEQPASGLVAPIGGAAMATGRYLDSYGIEREKLGAVPIAMREWAADNEDAALHEPLSAEEYAASPPVVEPLRRHDCSLPVDTATALLLVAGDRAAQLRARPVRILAFQGLPAGPNEFVFGQPGLGVNQRDRGTYAPLGAAEPVYRRAGIGPAEVDALYCYDGFSSQVPWTLERFGFCEPGEGCDWIQGGRIGRGGVLPLNTCGGHLAAGHSNGWGQTVELVRQLRGEAPARRQIPGCEVAQWATTFGDSIVYAA
ncbi:MAG TPA: thiolase family protein [Solirubrobacterales bacterium]|jgi:acetyl-CoA acetyltransferase